MSRRHLYQPTQVIGCAKRQGFGLGNPKFDLEHPHTNPADSRTLTPSQSRS
ncbi:hypothetical protein FDUTEX481_01193 [Tolypothrix sp. PCC 7601]|nr:hypothetical protein FDUTEX481_01193 [Tolypothrix sp. PCC 7601]